MSYEELIREISSQSVSQLPGILMRVVRLCVIKPVFRNRAAMLSFVSRSWDAGGVENREADEPRSKQ
jgi:hypothetical protein